MIHFVVAVCCQIKSLNRDILSRDVVTIDGIEYRIGQWISDNLAAYRNNKMNQVRLNLLREIPQQQNESSSIEFVT